jgi:hypothetical protein
MFPIPTDRSRLATIAMLAASSLLAFPGRADAAILTVGAPSSGCNHTSVQAAVNAAQGAPGADTIRISRSATWTAQQININTDSDIELIGGYETCGSTTPSGPQTELSGAGGDARSVITIRGNGIFRLRNLSIIDGDQAGDDNGGGIFYEGGGILDIADTSITENSAQDGAGIFAVGTTIQAELILGDNVSVGFNTARRDGGGIASYNIETTIGGSGTSLLFNVAQRNGGGLAVISEEFKSFAYISSSGIGGLGAIYGNTAANGGGIAVIGGVESGQDAEVHIFSRDSANPVRINGNTATVRGGAMYQKPDADSSGNALTYARLWNVEIAENTAPDGAAVYLDYDSGGALAPPWGGELFFNTATLPNAAPCPVGKPCGAIVRNSTNNENGSIIAMPGGDTFFEARRVVFQDNEGGRLMLQLEQDGWGGDIWIYNSLITDNAVQQDLIRLAGGEGSVALTNVTVANNEIGLPHVLFVDNTLRLDSSLFWQSGKLTLAASGGDREIEYVLTNDNTNMGNGPAAVASPRFVDPANRDYRLRAGSRAVDYAPTALPPNTGLSDMDGRARAVDVPIAGINAPARVRDVGAHERVQLLPLVLNQDFDTDLAFWEATGVSNWDGSQNASGPAGSGSVQSAVGIDDFTVRARTQCIHLPGPGTYYLNGWGRVTAGSPSANTVRLEWELRHNGGAFSCTSGAADQVGTHVLATAPTWRRPPVDDIIEVSAADWTQNTSLTVHLVVVNGNPLKGISGGGVPSLGGPTGWFDGITLGIEGDDTIFADGFE